MNIKQRMTSYFSLGIAVMVMTQPGFADTAPLPRPIAMGTDAGVEPHGLNAREFSLMSKNGLAAAQVLMAGTANGADLLGIADQTGTLQAGKYADIAAVPGNPLTDMKSTEHPVFVMKEGAIYLGAPADHSAQ